MEFARNHTILSMAWLGLFGVVVYMTFSSLFSKVKSINNHQATMLINKEDAVVIDTRSADEFAKGHISGSRHIPQTQIQEGKLSAIENFKSSPIIVLCETGVRSGSSANLLIKAGFSQVYNLSGGLSEWRAANLPVVKK
jgi:rhodanese-related sulfurtransferase